MKVQNYILFVFSFYCSTMLSQSHLGLFQNDLSIGDPIQQGFASYDAEQQTYTLRGSGENIWFDRDEFHYLWTTIQGDFILRAEGGLVGEGVNPHRKWGWMIRESLDENAPHVSGAIHGNGLASLQYRSIVGGDTEEMVMMDSFPDVLQLERSGNNYILSMAQSGQPFSSQKLELPVFDQEVYIGLYVCAHDTDVVETATFSNVRIIKPFPEGATPYQDYLGSHLEVMDIETGHRKIIHTSAHSIQAPNWTPDNKRLIYNSRGHLYNYWLEENRISPLNTGFAIQNNNDHVLTFDGKKLGISHHAEDNERKSTIYHMSADGDSTPVRVTAPGAGRSYLHGWSPDGQKMVFTGERGDQYDIIEIDVESGQEVNLTNLKTLDDGPEYSPDGEYIFFNSVRTGTMQLWRMKPDGSSQEQLTFDEYNDWFPHISPDKKWIVFISFPTDIDPSSHPFYKHCLLRIMPYEGGEPRVIGYVYGGQGTINVPSWSPDSRKISFVTNSGFW